MSVLSWHYQWNAFGIHNYRKVQVQGQVQEMENKDGIILSFLVNEFSMSSCNRYGFVQFISYQICMNSCPRQVCPLLRSTKTLLVFLSFMIYFFNERTDPETNAFIELLTASASFSFILNLCPKIIHINVSVFPAYIIYLNIKMRI